MEINIVFYSNCFGDIKICQADLQEAVLKRTGGLPDELFAEGNFPISLPTSVELPYFPQSLNKIRFNAVLNRLDFINTKLNLGEFYSHEYVKYLEELDALTAILVKDVQ